ncbi:MAG: N-formylglutamate amidohydrolase [Pseudomonadota bacterium]
MEAHHQPSPAIPDTRIDDEVAESFQVLAGRADAGIIIVCDHAENTFPPGYDTLGLPPDQLQRHIAYDIGAAAVTRNLAAFLQCPAILTRFSRLLIDPNRGRDDPTLIMRISDGAVIEGNRRLSKAEQALRVDRFYAPYHAAIDRTIDACSTAGRIPIILSIHSFTDVWRGRPRPWHCGVLWDQDHRLATPLLQALASDPELIVGNNEPYTGRMEGDCMWQHGTMRGLAHGIIELRQDLITEPAGQVAWAERLGQILQQLLADDDFKEHAHRVDFARSTAPDGAASTSPGNAVG